MSEKGAVYFSLVDKMGENDDMTYNAGFFSKKVYKNPLGIYCTWLSIAESIYNYISAKELILASNTI